MAAVFGGQEDRGCLHQLMRNIFANVLSAQMGVSWVRVNVNSANRD